MPNQRLANLTGNSGVGQIFDQAVCMLGEEIGL